MRQTCCGVYKRLPNIQGILPKAVSMTFSPSWGLLSQSMAGNLDSPLQNPLALSLPAYCNR